MNRRCLLISTAVAVTITIVAAAAVWLATGRDHDYTVTADFTSATGIYPGDNVTVLGVPVGTIRSIAPHPSGVTVTMAIDHDVTLPAGADAAIISQSLVAGRAIQLTPAYTTGPALRDRASIPLSRTAVPMEWDDVKKALYTTTKALSPTSPGDPGALADLVGTTSTALTGRGQQINDTITSLSKALSILSDGRDDIFGTVRNLAVFTSALSTSSAQIGQLQQRLATTATVLGSNRDEVNGAITSLDAVLADVQTFVNDNSAILTTNVESATDVTKNLAAQRQTIEGILHQAPTQLANFYNLYHPGIGDLVGSLSLTNFENPIATICGAIAGAGYETSEKAGQLCAQYIGPYLNTLKTSFPNVAINPVRTNFADPDQLVPSVPGVLTSVPGLKGNGPPPVSVPDQLASLLLPKAGR